MVLVKTKSIYPILVPSATSLDVLKHPLHQGKTNAYQLKIIEEFPGYCVDNEGSVWVYRKRKALLCGKGTKAYISNEARRMKPTINKIGYQVISLRKNKKKIQFKIHRLVAMAFIFNQNNFPFVCHKDGNKLNNHVNNLYWGTVMTNYWDSFRHGTAIRGEKCALSKLKEDEVELILHITKHSKINNKRIGEMFGVSVDTIRYIKRGVTWKYLKNKYDKKNNISCICS